MSVGYDPGTRTQLPRQAAPANRRLKDISLEAFAKVA